MGYSASVMIGRTRPAPVDPLAGRIIHLMANRTSSRVPIINDGMETNAVVMTMMTRSTILLRRRAAMDPRMTPTSRALNAAITPKRSETFKPREMIVMTLWPRCFREGPKSNFVTMSFR